MPTKKQSGPRTYVSDFEIKVGPINALGKLVKVTKTGVDEYKEFVSVCPTCPEPVKPEQRYICPNDATHSHPMRDLRKAKDIDGDLKFVEKDEIDAARASDLPVNVLRLTVHPKDEVWNKLWDSDNAYVFIPRNADEWFALLLRLVETTDKAFIGMCNLRNHEGLFRLDVWQGHIVVQKVVWPDEINEFDALPIQADDTLFEAAIAMIEKVEQPFDPTNYKSQVKDKLAAITTSLGGDPFAAVPSVPSKSESKLDVLAALQAFAS